MIASKWNQAAIACAMGLILAGTVCAAQGGQGKVFSNEDIETAPPPAAAPAPESDAAAAPAAGSDAAPAPTAGSKARAAQAAAAKAVLEADLQRSLDVQDTWRSFLEGLSAKGETERDPKLKERWARMAKSLDSLVQDNAATIDELKAKLKPPAEPTEEEPTPPAQ